MLMRMLTRMGTRMRVGTRTLAQGLGRRRASAVADAGMTTSEYAMGTIAACAFAAVLYKVVTSDMVSSALESVVGKALNGSF